MAAPRVVQVNVEFLATDRHAHHEPYSEMVKFRPNVGDYGQEHFRTKFNAMSLPSIIVSLHGDPIEVAEILKRGEGQGYYAAYSAFKNSHHGRNTWQNIEAHPNLRDFKCAAIITPSELCDDDTMLANEVAKLLINYKIYDVIEEKYRYQHPIPPRKADNNEGRELTVVFHHGTIFNGAYDSYSDILKYDERRGDFPLARSNINGEFDAIIEVIGELRDVARVVWEGRSLYGIISDRKGSPEVNTDGVRAYLIEMQSRKKEKINVHAAVVVSFEDLTAGRNSLATFVSQTLNNRWLIDLAIQEEEDALADV